MNLINSQLEVRDNIFSKSCEIVLKDREFIYESIEEKTEKIIEIFKKFEKEIFTINND